jgi:hypothetical protein
MTHVHAALIRGLSYSGSTEATLFVDGPLDASTIPAGLTPLSSSTQIVGRLLPAGLEGFNINSNIRSPLPSAVTAYAQLQDDAEGALAQLFAPDPGRLNTSTWIIQSTTTLAIESTSTFTVAGASAPSVGAVLYLDSEAMEVTAVTSVTTNLWEIDVDRGACGSHIKAHQVRPSSYPAGDDGTYAALTLHSRQPFETGRVEASLYSFLMDPANPGAVSACEWCWHGMIEKRPTQNRDFVVTVPVRHVTAHLAEHAPRFGKEIPLSRCVTVVQEMGTSVDGQSLPRVVRIPLNRYEAERLFDTALHAAPGQGKLSSSKVSSLSSKLSFSSASDGRLIETWILLEAGGYKYTFRANGFTYVNEQRAYVTATLVLNGWEDGASVRDKPLLYPPENGFTRLGFNQGFVSQGAAGANADRVRTEFGEEAPKVSLRQRVGGKFVTTLLHLALSGQGGGANDATWDKLFGNWPQIDPSWMNTGSAPADPLAVDEGTTTLLELNALIGQSYGYHFETGTTLGEWLRNELVLHCCLFSFEPSTGKLAARFWSRKRPASPTALNPIIYPDGEVETAETLEPMRALILQRGLNLITLKPKHEVPIQILETQEADFKNALTVRIWGEQSPEFAASELATGPLARMAHALFNVAAGEPHLWRIPLSVSSGVKFGDLVTWTDPSIPTAAGRGVTALPLIVLGLDRNPKDGRLTALCLWDVLGQQRATSASAGKRAPALKITAASNVSTRRYELTVSAPGDSGFNITSSYGGIFQTIATAGGRVRLINPTRHNPTAANETPGPLEGSATVNGISHVAGVNKIDVTIPAAWERSSITAANLVELGGWVCLQNYKTADSNPEGSPIQGHASQGYNGGSGRDFATLGSISTRPRFDGRKSLIGA